jgi:hypothetical protein
MQCSQNILEENPFQKIKKPWREPFPKNKKTLERTLSKK